MRLCGFCGFYAASSRRRCAAREGVLCRPIYTKPPPAYTKPFFMSTKGGTVDPGALEDELAAAGVTLFVRDGKLRAHGQNGLTEALRAQIAEHRAELLDYFARHTGPQNPQNAQNLQGTEGQHTSQTDHGAQNPQNPQNRAGQDVAWIKERMTSVYGLIKEALREGYLGPAQQVGADVVQMVEGVARADGDVARACRLASRDGAGNDVAAAALLSAYELLCRALAGHGVDVFRRRAAVALCAREAARLQGAAAQAAADERATRGSRSRRASDARRR